ncbi:MAG: GAF domain-containing protein [Brevinema sp.]
MLHPLESYIKDLKQVYYLTSTIQKYSDLKQLLSVMLKECISMTQASGGSIMFRHRQSDRLFFYVTEGLDQQTLDKTNMSVGDGIAGMVIAEGIPKIINDIILDPKYITINSNFRSEMAVPIIVDSTVLGVIVLDQTVVGAFTDKHLELVQMVCSYTGFVISYHIKVLTAEKTSRLLENMMNITSIKSAEDIFKILTKELRAESACIINEQGIVLFQEGNLIEEISLSTNLFEKSSYTILKTENSQQIPYTRIIIPRIQKDMTFIADKVYYFSENVQIDIDFANKILEFLATKDSKFHHDETLSQWAERKMDSPAGQVYDLAVGSIEKEVIIAALKRCKHNRLKTAKFLGINRNTLRHKMEIFGLEK